MDVSYAGFVVPFAVTRKFHLAKHSICCKNETQVRYNVKFQSNFLPPVMRWLETQT